jgi:predicted nucleic acid-binding Zn ribbon protein
MPNHVRSVLERTLQSSGLARTMQRQLPPHIWNAVVGAEVAKRAQPTVLTAGALHVLVEDHRWRDQLDAMRTTLVERLNARLGKPMVRELRFGLAHKGALLQRARTEPRARPALGAAPHMHGAERLAPELRDAFLRAAHASRSSQLAEQVAVA